MKVLVASNNAGKLREFKKILNFKNIEILCPEDIGIYLDVEESGKSFEENAFIKAEAFCKASGMISIADDSGLCVEALNGEPGVQSARYTGRHSDSDDDRIEFLLCKLNGEKNRKAKFVSHVCAVFPDGRRIDAEGELFGQIGFEMRGSGGFGYDSVFLPQGGERTLAEMTLDEKNSISHRKRALDKLRNKLGDVYA